MSAVGLLLAVCGLLPVTCHEKPIIKTRAETIPLDAVKRTPATDFYPPVLIDSADFEPPIPMPGPVNTAGAEDSPFMLPDGQDFYFFFTPDVRKSPQEQLGDGVTGIWWTKRNGQTWTEPERVWLGRNEALDGAECVLGDTMWFASVRVGNFSDIDIYKAVQKNGAWGSVRNAGKRLSQTLDIGEFHLTANGDTLYFHWNHTGGYGGLDLWKVARSGDTWGEPVNLGPVVNTAQDEGWPFVSQDGKELWFTRDHGSIGPVPAVFRSVLTDSGWGAPQEIVTRFAGEPTLDNAGNLYFTHHFYDDFNASGKMLEADIYYCRKR
jgi:hypothetical protein